MNPRTDTDAAPACCAPARPEAKALLPAPAPGPLASASARSAHLIEQVRIPAQRFLMGDARGDGRRGDGETPVHPVSLAAFAIDATSVTNGDFARFIGATDYRTDAERYGSSAVFHLALAAPAADIIGPVSGTPWWVAVAGADWAHPGGGESDVLDLQDHPVVHISWNDAQAYCEWAGRALPTEAQWEAASRGGLDGARYPWGEERDETRMNIWQGVFPVENTLEDGYLTTAPVRSYDPNAYGLWQTVGNVWEWCADWWDPRYYAVSPENDPAGPIRGTVRVLRGGSYLCHDSYCNRYRNAARSSNTADSSMGNAGFRTVARTSR
ncbi:formylglycine-generating enzyme family protein [Rathayibacter festucae]|uniref:Sulfatase modifying factor 1 (C-alpha-formyglycine-generating enzyme 1) n=1 Tax=Rathayibacter festucae DSM 15932 TaxID=1328866 RepID=A0A3Q9UXX6_9MICO|nr:formylglycine-generating enzyme family protein [Rathayibacter festucae]AZZ51784.1 sulfatase modifying factor 1 (C-alpha-formyglycine- generating enzyme 1) [Rathayibacter festucae DSM 15932]